MGLSWAALWAGQRRKRLPGGGGDAEGDEDRVGGDKRAPLGEVADGVGAAQAHGDADRSADHGRASRPRSGTACRMSRRRAPTAMRSPISRVRSVTDTSMMFMMPMPPTSSETDAIAASKYVITREASSCTCVSLGMRTVKSSSWFCGRRWRWRSSSRICPPPREVLPLPHLHGEHPHARACPETRPNSFGVRWKAAPSRCRLDRGPGVLTGLQDSDDGERARA